MAEEVCEHCEFILGDVTSIGETVFENADEFFLRKYRNGSYYIVCNGEHYGEEREVPISFCPWCGRKLK